MKKMTLALGMLLTASASAVAVEHLGSVDRKSIDNSIAPGEDFYRHVNNGWMKATPSPTNMPAMACSMFSTTRLRKM